MSTTDAGPASALEIHDLRAGIAGRDILFGVSVTVPAGEVHAVMGPNGSGKSTLAHVLMGRPGYERITGQALLDGVDLLLLPTWRRAQQGLFLGMQYPTEVPGVRMDDMLFLAANAGDPALTRAEVTARMNVEADRIGFDRKFFERALNVDLSGGEKKRNETVQLGVLRPKFALLDEVDSGLDVDALRAVSRRVLDESREHGLGVLAITHYNRLLAELRPDVVHVFVKGRIVRSGGPELALELERTGYEPYIAELAASEPEPIGVGARAGRRTIEDPFADPFA